MVSRQKYLEKSVKQRIFRATKQLAIVKKELDRKITPVLIEIEDEVAIQPAAFETVQVYVVAVVGLTVTAAPFNAPGFQVYVNAGFVNTIPKTLMV
jgi:hypothetical protein